MKNPLEADPECAQFAKLILKQAQQEDFGFSRTQVRRIQGTDRGRKVWKTLTESCFKDFPGRGRKFDFSLFCKELCNPEFADTRRCFRIAKEEYSHLDPREVCFVQIWDLCKRVEHVWSDLHALAGS